MIILTKDKDFVNFWERFGPPPKIVQLEILNSRTALVEDLLKNNKSKILSFEQSSEGLLLIHNREFEKREIPDRSEQQPPETNQLDDGFQPEARYYKFHKQEKGIKDSNSLSPRQRAEQDIANKSRVSDQEIER